MLKNIILQLFYQISLYLCIVKQKERGLKNKESNISDKLLETTKSE